MTTTTAPAATVLAPGMTCNRGKGKTLWEIIAINDRTHMVELSALGKGGYTNKHTTADELTNIHDQELHTPLFVVLGSRAAAKAKAAALDHALRFTNAARIDEANREAGEAAARFAAYCRSHSAGLAEMGIEES